LLQSVMRLDVRNKVSWQKFVLTSNT